MYAHRATTWACKLFSLAEQSERCKTFQWLTHLTVWTVILSPFISLYDLFCISLLSLPVMAESPYPHAVTAYGFPPYHVSQLEQHIGYKTSKLHSYCRAKPHNRLLTCTGKKETLLPSWSSRLHKLQINFRANLFFFSCWWQICRAIQVDQNQEGEFEG